MKKVAEYRRYVPMAPDLPGQDLVLYEVFRVLPLVYHLRANGFRIKAAPRFFPSKSAALRYAESFRRAKKS